MSVPSERGVVLVTWPDYPGPGTPEATSLQEAGLTLRRAPRHAHRTEAEMIELARGCVAAIVSTDPFTRAVFEAAPTLRLVSRVGIGVGAIDLEAAGEHGVGVTAAVGTNEAAVADHTVGLMLALLRRIPELDTTVREGLWVRTGMWAGADLHGRTVGLLGMGRIAQLVSRRLTGFEVDLIGYDPAGIEIDGVERCTNLREMITRSDVLSLHLPLTSETKGLVDRALLDGLPEGAIVVNTARGGIIDEVALAEAIDAGHLRGAAIDVFAQEPPVDSSLLGLRQATVLTPHVAGLTAESISDMVRHATEAVLAVTRGKLPHDLMNDPVGPAWRPRPMDSAAALPRP